MKKIISMGLAAAAILSLAGCSAKGEPMNNAADSGYVGTDIGGVGSSDKGSTGGGFLGGIGDMLTEAFSMGTKAEFAVGAAADGMAPMAPGSAAMDTDMDMPIIDPVMPVEPIDPIEPIEPAIQPQSGLLTGGEWRDNDHREDWNALYESHQDWSGYKDAWRAHVTNRIAVKVLSDGKPLEGAAVSAEGFTSAVSDNKGMAYIFGDGVLSSGITVSCGDVSTVLEPEHTGGDLAVTAELNGAVSPIGKKLDLMIMCDTTGSMGDELEYLKVELSDIVTKIKGQNSNIPTRISVNFYRDEGDEYMVRQFPFSENVADVVKAIGEQSANGGGDFPEAVHEALKSAVSGHDWAEDSVKVMFLVLDAPPHEDAQIVDTVNKYVEAAAAKGIRIIPVASSGIDKSTEYLLRVMAMTTGGTYTFLTDDSGVGGGHIEPTVGAFNVEKLNDMMVRIVNGYLE